MNQPITSLAILLLALLNPAPTPAQTAAAAPAKLHVKRDLSYAEPADPRRKVDIYAPEGAKNLPVVFWIHGGGWQAGDRTSIQVKPQAFADKGFVFVSTGYRLLTNVNMVTIFRDVAKSFRWVHDHIAEHGGDPNRILVMGHSAGAQLAALICTDDRYLKAEGLSLNLIKGCVPVDGDTYDVPAIIETAETRLRVHGLPMPKFGHRLKFGNDPEKHRDYSAVTHVARGKGIPPFLILHVADHPDTTAQAQRLGAVLRNAGIPAKLFAAKESNHTKLNENLGLPDDLATKALFEFVGESLNLAQTASLPPKEKFHLFLLVGQSNMAGRGVVTPQDKTPHPRVLMLNQAGEWVPAVDPLHFDKPGIAGVGLGRAFGIAIADANPGVTVGLIPCAVGGSPLDSWQPGVFYPPTKSHPWDDAMRRAQLALPSGTLKGILWHQGESDATPELAPAYEAKLHALIARFRGDLGAPEVPFVAGQLGRFADKPWSEFTAKIDQAHRELPRKVPHTALVSSEGLKDKGDQVHFDADSYREFGRRYADAYSNVRREK